MVAVKHVLQRLALGNSVAEFDKQLESYFVETRPFQELVEDNVDIIAGDKGTGKTAIFRVLQQRFIQIPALRNVVVVPAFNPTGNPIFQALAQREVLDEGEYGRMWKAFVLSLVGNWVLKHNKAPKNSNLARLDLLLKGLDLRSESETPQSAFQKVMAKLGKLFHWKSAELKMATTVEGEISITPRVEFGDADANKEVQVSVEAALRHLSAAL